MSSSRHQWLVLLAMTGALSMVTLDQTVVTVALPTMSRELPLTATGQQWAVNAYVLAMAALVAIGGKAGDRFGPVTTFRAGVTLFFAASVGCGLAPHGDLGEPTMIAFRALQGGGAALMMPVSASIVMDAFPAVRRGRAMAVYAGISQSFLAVGPLLGGALTQAVSWRAVFWLNVPVGLIALLLVRWACPNNNPYAGARIRVLPVVLLVTGLGLTVLAIQQSSVWSWTSPLTLTTVGVGLTMTAAFVLLQLHSASPLVDIRLFARPGLLGNLTVVALMQFGLLAVVLYSSIYLQDLLHLDPVHTGLAVLPMIAAIAIASQISGRWYDRAGVRPPVLTGSALSLLGLIAWTTALPHLAYWTQVPGMVLTGVGLGLVISPTNTDALAGVRSAERAQTSGLVQTVRQLGGTLGVALIGAVVVGVGGSAGLGGPPQHTADAITAGFAAAAVAFAVALVAGHVLLSRERVPPTTPGDQAEDVVV